MLRMKNQLNEKDLQLLEIKTKGTLICLSFIDISSVYDCRDLLSYGVSPPHISVYIPFLGLRDIAELRGALKRKEVMLKGKDTEISR
jgi:hypothetical protein